MTTFLCPACGACLDVRRGDEPLGNPRGESPGSVSSSGPTRLMKRYEMGSGAPPALYKEMIITTPHRAPTREGDLIVILGQALVSTVVVGAASGMLTALLHWPWKVPALATSAALVASWFYLLTDQRGLLRRVERYIGADLDGDGQIGPPDPPVAPRPVPTTRVEINETMRNSTGQPVARRESYDIIRVSSPELDYIGFRVITQGQPFSKDGIARLEGSVVKETRFRQIQEEFVRVGYARWKNAQAHHQGALLTKKGMAILRHHADNYVELEEDPPAPPEPELARA